MKIYCVTTNHREQKTRKIELTTEVRRTDFAGRISAYGNLWKKIQREARELAEKNQGTGKARTYQIITEKGEVLNHYPDAAYVIIDREKFEK